MEFNRLNRRNFDVKPKKNNKKYRKQSSLEADEIEVDTEMVVSQEIVNVETQNVETQNVEPTENDNSWAKVVRKGKPIQVSESTDKVIEVKTTDVEQQVEHELEEKLAKMKSWQVAKNKVTNEYLALLCSYTKQEILNKIIRAQHIIDRTTGQPYNYVTLSCRAYDANQEPVDILTQDGFKFVLNQFFGNEYFVKQIKEHYKKMGYNVGFKSRKFDDNEFRTYTDLKIYYV